MLLDVGNAIFVWLGKDSNENEKKLASEAASDYLSSDPTGRDKDIPVIVTKQGNEPPHFTGNFGAWDPTLWDNMVYWSKLMLNPMQTVFDITKCEILKWNFVQIFVIVVDSW